jgi:hypothetical protein
MRLVLAAALVMAVGTARAQIAKDWTVSPTASMLAPPVHSCCVTFSAVGGTVTINLGKGTVDLGGAKMDDAARAFWDAVRTVAHRPAQPRAYTLDEIDRMRAAMKELQYPPCPVAMGRCSPAFTADEIESRLRTYMSAGISPEALETKAKDH